MTRRRAPPRAPRPRNVVARSRAAARADIAAELADVRRRASRDGRRRRRTPRPSPFAWRRPACTSSPRSSARSPSAGEIAAADDDIVARARAYEAGGAAAISVLCEPHWFGGSVEDLRAVRAAVACRSSPRSSSSTAPAGRCSAPPAPTWCCCWRCSIARDGCARSSTRPLDLGLEPLVEAHDARELDAALATRARADRHQQPRPAHARRRSRARRAPSRARSPTIGLSSPSPASATPRRSGWRALGFDAALVGEALMRAGDPAAAARGLRRRRPRARRILPTATRTPR